MKARSLSLHSRCAQTTHVRCISEEKKKSLPTVESYRPPVEGKERDLYINDRGQVVNLLNKRKVALIFGYIGSGYQGLQRNPRIITIEDDLEKAIHAAGGVSDQNYGNFHKIAWQRAARTDKGVHALGNVASLKMQKSDDPQIVQRINDNLPPAIKVFGVCRALQGFDAKSWADFRIYDYLYPTFAFKDTADPNWKFDEKTLQKLTDYCKLLEGHHNFWNFSVERKFADRSSERYLKSVTVSKPFEFGGIEFVKFKFVGLSFMLHQIRKMIAWVLLAYKLNAHPNMITNAYGPKHINIPIAPAQFLYLDKVMYNDYAMRVNDVKSPLPPVDVDVWKSEREKFKIEAVYPRIVADEVENNLAQGFEEFLQNFHPKCNGESIPLGRWLEEQKNIGSLP